MKKEYRIVTNGNKYRIQGREKTFLFWSSWGEFYGDGFYDTLAEAMNEKTKRERKLGPWVKVDMGKAKIGE